MSTVWRSCLHRIVIAIVIHGHLLQIMEASIPVALGYDASMKETPKLFRHKGVSALVGLARSRDNVGVFFFELETPRLFRHKGVSVLQ
jgi:hypothetical protein